MDSVLKALKTVGALAAVTAVAAAVQVYVAEKVKKHLGAEKKPEDK